MNEYFDKAFSFTIGKEGGYVNDPFDPGGETKFGISKKSYPKEDIKNIAIERAKEIYYKDFWVLSNCDKLVSMGYPLTAIALFDGSVNCGVSTSKKFIQQYLNVHIDGILGPKTMQEISLKKDFDLCDGLIGKRENYYSQIISVNPKLCKFEKGWANRVRDLKIFLNLT